MKFGEITQMFKFLVYAGRFEILRIFCSSRCKRTTANTYYTNLFDIVKRIRLMKGETKKGETFNINHVLVEFLAKAF